MRATAMNAGSYNGRAYVLNSVHAQRVPPMEGRGSATYPNKSPGDFRGGNWEPHKMPMNMLSMRTPGMRSPQERILTSAGRRGGLARPRRPMGNYMNYQSPKTSMDMMRRGPHGGSRDFKDLNASAAPFVPGATPTKDYRRNGSYGRNTGPRSSTWDICWDFKKGNCKRESRCKWRHVIEAVASMEAGKPEVCASSEQKPKPETVIENAVAPAPSTAAGEKTEPEKQMKKETVAQPVEDHRELTPEDDEDSEPSEEPGIIE